MFKKLLSICLVVSLLLTTVEAVEFREINTNDKINLELLEIMQNSDKDEKIPVSIWIVDIDQKQLTLPKKYHIINIYYI